MQQLVGCAKNMAERVFAPHQAAPLTLQLATSAIGTARTEYALLEDVTQMQLHGDCAESMVRTGSARSTVVQPTRTLAAFALSIRKLLETLYVFAVFLLFSLYTLQLLGYSIY